jgi:hypothetical protein
LFCSSGKATAPSISFDQLHDAVVKGFGGLLHGSGEVESNLSQMQDEVKALSSIVTGWDVSQCGEEETLQLLTMIEGLESSFSRSSRQASRLVGRQADLSTCHQLRVLVHDKLDLATLAPGAAGEANPWVWQKQHGSLLEAAVQRRKVRNLRSVASLSATVSSAEEAAAAPLRRDPRGLGGVGVHYLGTSLKKKRTSSSSSSSSGRGGVVERVDVDLAIVEVKRTAAGSAWHAYDFFRQLSLSPYFLDTVAVDDNSDPEFTRFIYEYCPSTSLGALFRIRGGGGGGGGGSSGKSYGRGVAGGKQLGESSPLFLHWTRSCLRALADLEKCTTYTFLPSASTAAAAAVIGLDSVFVSNHGSSVRLGVAKSNGGGGSSGSGGSGGSGGGSSLALMDVSGGGQAQALEQRSCALLRSWADFVDDLFLLWSGGSEEGGGSGGRGGLGGGSGRGSDGDREKEMTAKHRRGNAAMTMTPPSTPTTAAAAAVKRFSSSEAFAGIYLNPGDRFEIRLDALKRHGSVWQDPEVVALSGGSSGSSLEVFASSSSSGGGGSSGASVVSVAAGLALRPGRSELRFFCSHHGQQQQQQEASRNELALVVPVIVQGTAMSPVLTAILKCCRATSPGHIAAAAGASPSASSPFNNNRSGDGGSMRNFPLTLGMLCTHDYFATAPDIDEVMSAYAQHFES